MMLTSKHFACTRALRARTCTRSDLISSTFPARPEKVEAGRGCTLFRPRHPVRASRLRRFARHLGQHYFASADAAALGAPASARSVPVRPLPGRGEGRERGEPLTLVAFGDAEQRRASRGCRASTVRSTWRAAGAIVRVSTPAGLTEQRKEPAKPASSQARLSLLTFFGKTKKVSGPAAVKRVVAEGNATRSARAKANLGPGLRRGDDRSARRASRRSGAAPHRQLRAPRELT